MTIIEIAYDLLESYSAAELERLELKGADLEEIEAAQEEIDEIRERIRAAEVAEMAREEFSIY